MKRIIVGFSLLLAACSSKMYQPASLVYNDYRITQNTPKDSGLNQMLKVYADSVNSTMNGVIGTVAEPLNKAQPEGALGNFMTDAMLIMARKNFKQPVDAAFVNYGGIRLSQLAAGPITTGKIFELMPFDNIMVLLPLKGDTLQSFLNLVASWADGRLQVLLTPFKAIWLPMCWLMVNLLARTVLTILPLVITLPMGEMIAQC